MFSCENSQCQLMIKDFFVTNYGLYVPQFLNGLYTNHIYHTFPFDALGYKLEIKPIPKLRNESLLKIFDIIK